MYNFFKTLSIYFLILGVSITLSGCKTTNHPSFYDGQKVDAQIGSQTYHLEVAQSDSARAKGLSGRTKLGDDAGMLFVFETDDYHSFWMKDTLIPLEIIWLDTDFKVVDVKEMAVEEDPAHPTTSYTPKHPARYAIEINPGVDIKIGDKIDLSF